MYCSECGKEMPGNAVFCPECGARQNGEGLSETAAGSAAAAGIPSQEQKKAKKHRRIGKAVVGLIVIAVGIVGWNIRGMWQERELSTVVKYQDLYCLDREAGIIYDRNGNSYGSNVLVFNEFSNMDGTVEVYVSDGTLYYLKDSETHVVDQDVELEFLSLKFSGSGEVFAYIKRVNAPDKNEQAVLCVYDLKNDELEIIEENAEIGNCLLSTDGEIVAYNSGDGEKNTLYIKKKGKESVKIAKNGAIPLLIGEEKLLYEKNGKLYLYNGKESSKIASLEEEKFVGYSNIDGTELLYSDRSNIYFLNLKTEENRKIVSGSLGELVGHCVRRFALDGYDIYDGRDVPDSTIYVFGLKTFCNKAFSTDAGSVYLLDRKGEANRLPSLTGSVSSGSTYLFSDDWKQYVYLSGSSLFLVKNIEDGKAEQLTEDEVKYVTCSGDLKEIYYVTEDDELYYLNRGKPVLLSDDVKDEEWYGDAVAAVRYSERFEGVCFIEDDDLYFAGKSEKSRELLYEDVESLSLYYDWNSFCTEEETEPGSSTYKSSTYWMADKSTFIKRW